MLLKKKNYIEQYSWQEDMMYLGIQVVFHVIYLSVIVNTDDNVYILLGVYLDQLHKILHKNKTIHLKIKHIIL